jgi:hypothetical protein
MSSGFFEDDGSGNLQPIASLAGVTDMWWEDDGVGNIVPRTTEVDPNFPLEPQVQSGVYFGYALEFLGSLPGGGGMSTTPFWMSVVSAPATSSWLVSVGNIESDATVFIYEQGTNLLLYTMPRSFGHVPLTSVDLGGKTVYCKIQEGSLAVSSRFPALNGIVVQVLSTASTQPNQVSGLTQEVLQPGGVENAALLGFKDARQTTYLTDKNQITGNMTGRPL